MQQAPAIPTPTRLETQVTAKSLVLDLLSTLGSHAAPVRALVEAAALFEIADNNVRVTLARLLAAGRVERDERGRYRIGPGSRAVNEQIRRWRRLEDRVRPWDGGWIGVQTGGLPRRDGPQRRRRERALRLLGFRGLETGLEIRPDNLAGGVAAVRAELRDLGLEARAPVFRLSDLDPADDTRARGLWDVAALVSAYRAGVARLETSAARLPELPRGEAMVESFTIGGDALRQLVLDPLLPEPIAPARERAALLAAMQRYDRLGRQAWSRWLGADAPRPDSLPAGIRAAGIGAAGIGGLEAAGDSRRAAGGE